jgi:hypothetical protein
VIDSLVKEVTTAPQQAAIIRCRCLLLPAFLLLLPPAADEDSRMFEVDDELEAGDGGSSLVPAMTSAGTLSVAILMEWLVVFAVLSRQM